MDKARTRERRIALVAGEPSGDVLGSRVLRALKRALPGCVLHAEGIGGEAMIAEGFQTLYPLERLSVMGLVEPLGRLPELLRIRRALYRRWSANPPALFLGIDAPDFNLRLARRLRDAGLRTAQLVSPTVWAWRPGRVRQVARAVDSLLCLVPFEPSLYRALDVDARFVGHPVAQELARMPDRAQARRDLGLAAQATVIALLPGSRAAEVAQLAPPLIAAGELLRARDPRRELLMPAASKERAGELRALLERRTRRGKGAGAIRVVDGDSRRAMIAADLVLLASGTASLEAMLLRRPMVIAYRVSPLSWALISRLAVTPYAGMPNILARRRVVPELLQGDLSPAALAREAENLLAEGAAQVAALAPCRAALATQFDAAVGQALGEWVRDAPPGAGKSRA